MTLDARNKRVAATLAERYGKPVTLQRVEETFDPATGQTTTTTSDVPAQGMPPKDFTTAQLADTLIEGGDTVVDVPAEGLDMTSTGGGGDTAPTTSDKAVFDGTTWTIVQVGEVFGGAEVAVFRLQLRN